MLFIKKTMDGLLGLLGGYYEFTGWGGDLVSKETRVAVTMDSDKTVKAMFRADYTMPLIYVAILVAILLFAVFIIVRLKAYSALLVHANDYRHTPHILCLVELQKANQQGLVLQYR